MQKEASKNSAKKEKEFFQVAHMPESEFKLHDGKALLDYKEWKAKENQLETFSVKVDDHYRATLRSSSAA